MTTYTHRPSPPEDAECEALKEAAGAPGSKQLFPDKRWVHIPGLHVQALDYLKTEIEHIREEWKSDEGFSPIEHVKARIKEPASILDNLSRMGLEPTAANLAEHVHDVAGIRIVFAFVTDIYLLLERIGRRGDLRILWIKDYIMNPKPNGYRSLHLLLSVPVESGGRTCGVRVEVQMRTLAMDFWASLEHILLYKYDRNVPEHLAAELMSAAGAAGELDSKMLGLRSEVLSLSEEEERAARAAHAAAGNAEPNLHEE
ncbi:GTP pyrophosphokinase family protein [Saccharibacillus sp. CPCC 101409]|uniref:GTP pyrophosphokinase n=1 Tax=Saccharibacillus sp. CPCC 101409 TaxID=3058041 RepID=UPI002673B150|nr:GTP pyrophosphokinase family protein [Saccharibacillus sp. CPCC 101409]MDO3411455.1 GTP pyrophosphokinase family protein [Saccharibacillus sp. CPCC 101409]